MTYPFKNLVFKGGGIRGIAYLGAIKLLEEKGILQQSTRVAGASAGAVTAMLVALGFTYDEIKACADSLDYKKVPGIPTWEQARSVGDDDDDEEATRGVSDWFGKINTDAKQVRFLFSKKGLHTSGYLYEWICKQIEKKFGRPDVSFKELADEPGCKDLYVTITNISNTSSHICCAKHTPELEVAEAVRTSMSIPVYFESVEFENIYLKGYFGDGGVMNNYPINTFDSEIRENPETLGLFLYNITKPQSFDPHYDLKSYIGDLVGSLLVAQDWAVARQKEDVMRTVQIWDCAISATNFDITTGDELYNKLYDEGVKGTKRYFELYDAGNKEELAKALFIGDVAGFG